MEYHNRNPEAYKKSLHKWYENLKKDQVKYRAYIQRISENRRNKRKIELDKKENEPAQTIKTNESEQRKTDAAEKEKNPSTDSIVPPAVPAVFSVDKNGQLSLF